MCPHTNGVDFFKTKKTAAMWLVHAPLQTIGNILVCFILVRIRKRVVLHAYGVPYNSYVFIMIQYNHMFHDDPWWLTCAKIDSRIVGSILVRFSTDICYTNMVCDQTSALMLSISLLGIIRLFWPNSLLMSLGSEPNRQKRIGHVGRVHLCMCFTHMCPKSQPTCCWSTHLCQHRQSTFVAQF